MNSEETKSIGAFGIDSSCRLPLLALFGGAALWLVLGLLLGLAAAMSFHQPAMFANCACLTYGRAQAAANDLILYGFVIPAALGVMLWVLARLSQAPLALPIVPLAGANLWHLGVVLGTGAILAGQSTGYPWLEYPRGPAVLLCTGFGLVGVSAAATMGFRARRELYPSHGFLFAALLWFLWAYSTANLFLLSGTPPRGVVQAIIAWWFANNILLVWLALMGVGLAFYFLPKLAEKPLAGSGYVLFAFLTLIFFGAWCGIPRSAPVPAWLPATSTYAAMLTVIPVVAIAVITRKTLRGTGLSIGGGPFCFLKFGTVSFVVSALLYLLEFAPYHHRFTDFTWFNFGVTQWQLFGFAVMVLCGAIYYVLPRVMEADLPFKGFAKLSFFFFAIGALAYAIPLIAGGLVQGMKLQNPEVSFADVRSGTLMFIRISTTGQLLLLLGALGLLLNVFAMTLHWKVGLGRAALGAVRAWKTGPSEVKP